MTSPAEGTPAAERPLDRPLLVLKMSEGGPAVIRDVCASRGWVDYDPDAPPGDVRGEWNLLWRSGRFKPSEYKNACLGQRLNHFPKSDGITRKDHLLRALRKFTGIHGKVYDIHPPAFILPTRASGSASRST
jgi:tubulin polyglutamylase TTLL2